MAKRTKLERLLRSDEILNYETTVDDTYEWFKVLNREIFENALPPIDEIDIRWRRMAYAWYDYDETLPGTGTTKLLLSKKYRTKQFFVAVLFHEMVHHYQYIYGEPVGHGKSFFRWKEKANQYGLEFGIVL